MQLMIQRNFHTKQFSLEFELKPLTDRSLILYVTEPESAFFASLLLKGGILEFQIVTFGWFLLSQMIIRMHWKRDDTMKIYLTGNKKLDIDGDIVSVKSGTIIPMGEWTRIRAGRFGQKLYLSVNGITNSKVMPADNNVMLNSLSIYFGEYEICYYLPDFKHHIDLREPDNGKR